MYSFVCLYSILLEKSKHTSENVARGITYLNRSVAIIILLLLLKSEIISFLRRRFWWDSILQQSQVNAMVNRFLVSAKLLAGAGGTAWWMRRHEGRVHHGCIRRLLVAAHAILWVRYQSASLPRNLHCCLQVENRDGMARERSASACCPFRCDTIRAKITLWPVSQLSQVSQSGRTLLRSDREPHLWSNKYTYMCPKCPKYPKSGQLLRRSVSIHTWKSASMSLHPWQWILSHAMRHPKKSICMDLFSHLSRYDNICASFLLLVACFIV